MNAIRYIGAPSSAPCRPSSRTSAPNGYCIAMASTSSRCTRSSIATTAVSPAKRVRSGSMLTKKPSASR
ncbi:polyketide synthase domain protein [Burkholderia pseudomallei TSV5]|nr:polyketide synthase domain protein [Burkholderia pseudomallei MSHR4868]KGX66049.1 polyketide synthase domain protein [Burkholderia pseudomallei TSV5]